MQSNKKIKRNGFTLVELSIVLVVIAIIIGGVLAGQEIVESAKLNSIATDFSKYERLVNTFKLKYDAIPGDMSNAEEYWSTATDGDGDGKITGVTTVAEASSAWEMLGLAGLTPPYTWIDTALTAGEAGTNYPKSRYCTLCGFSFFSEEMASVIAVSWSYDTLTVNRLVLGHQVTAAPGLPTGYALTGQGAKQVDAKIDDGIPITGRVLGGVGDVVVVGISGSCVSGGQYNSVETRPGCALVYTLDVDDQ